MSNCNKDLDKSLKKTERIISKGDLPQALKHLTSLYKESPADSRVLALLAHVYALLGNLQSAKTLATKASILNRSNIKAQYILGFCHQNLKEYIEAANVYKQIAEEVPASEVAQLFLAESLKKAGKIKDALLAYQKAAVLDEEGDIKRLAEEKIAELKEATETT